MCETCERSVRWIGPDACDRCGRPRSPRLDSCGDCRRRSFAFDRARAAAVYEGPAREVVKAFKLLGERRMAADLAERMVAAAKLLPADVVTWVPSTRASEVERGFNPAESLARPLARGLRLPARPLLVKTHATTDQAGLSREERRSNLRGVFRATGRIPLRVLLVDDILTTGSTAHECASELKRAGAREVSVVTFARAL